MIRRSPRALALWSAALLVAIITAVVVASDLAAIHRRATDLGPVAPAVVATRDLGLGRRVGLRDLAVRPVHRSQLPTGALTGRSGLDGRVVAVPVLRGGFVTRRNLAPRHRTGLDGVLPSGTRAMHVAVTDARVARVGATVDVVASSNASGDAADGGSTVVVASSALVLATDHAGAAGTGHDGAGVTLLVDATEVLDLADAQANRVVTLALVPPEDARARAEPR